MRAGLNNDAVQLVKLMKSKNIHFKYEISSIIHDATYVYDSWLVAKELAEQYEKDIDRSVLYHIEGSFIRNGWSLDQIDNWLAERCKSNNEFWYQERIEFNRNHNRKNPMLDELNKQLKDSINSIEKVIGILILYTYAYNPEKDTIDLKWLAEGIKPTNSMTARRIASLFDQLNNNSEAVEFYKLALNIPLQESEIRSIASNYNSPMNHETLKLLYEVGIKEDLSKCLIKTGQKKEAEDIMVDANSIREQNHLGNNIQFAGGVQKMTGIHIIENKIKKEKKLNKGNPEYWEKRREYYRGRENIKKEKKAISKGIKALKHLYSTDSLQHVWRYQCFVDDYCWLLNKKEEKKEKAFQIYMAEIRKYGIESKWTSIIIDELVRDYDKFILSTEEIYWKWLDKDKDWDYSGERLLWEMLQNADDKDVLTYISRAEKLTENNPNRSHHLGWILNRMKYPERSLPLLEYAVKNINKQDLKRSAAFALYETYIDMNNWQKAEEVFDTISNTFEERELQEFLMKISINASKTGNKDDAMRILKIVHNINPYYNKFIEDFIKYGMRDELVVYYNEMAAKIPDSEIPAKALKMIDK
jgi:hypothetical protein